LEELAHNCKIITKETFKLHNLEPRPWPEFYSQKLNYDLLNNRRMHCR
jgi:hypothetical protein